MDETAIISAVLYDRQAYDSVSDHVDPGEFSALGGAVYESVIDYYDRDPDATKCDADILRGRLLKRMPKHEASLQELFKEISPDRGSQNVVHDIISMKREKAGRVLAMGIAAQKDAKELAPDLEEFARLNDATELSAGFKVLEKSFAELVQESANPATPVPLFPARLQPALRGGALPGHCVVIIGRVNVGKSALMIYNLAGMLRKGKKVLLIENEDLPDDVKRRVGCCLVGCSLEWAEANPDEFDSKCKKYGGDNLIIPDPVPGTSRDVARAVEHFKPDVCAVNQVRHLAPGREAASDNTGAVDRVAQQLRAIGKRTRTVMLLVGAAKEGEVGKDGEIKEKAVLQMADSYGSRTGIPGCADIMLGIGTNEQLRERDMVAITICKNKRKAMKRDVVLYQKLDGENCRFTGA